MTAKWLAVMTVLSLVQILGATGGMQGSLKIVFIYVGPVGDYGWTYAHDQGRKFLEKALPDVKPTRPPKERPQTVSSTSAPTSLPRRAIPRRRHRRLSGVGLMVWGIIRMRANSRPRNMWCPPSGIGARTMSRRSSGSVPGAGKAPTIGGPSAAV